MKFHHVFAVVAIATLFCLTQTHAVAPGAKITLTQAGLTYVKDVGVDILLAQLASVEVPNMSGSAGTPVGHVDYSVTNIKISELKLPDAELELKAGEGLEVGVSDATCAVSLDFHWREHSWPHVSGSGSADVAISSTSVSVVVAVGESNQRPTVGVSSAAVDIGGFSIHVHGSESWLYNWLVGLFKGSIKGSIQSSLKDAIVNAVNQQAEHALATIPIVQKIDDFSSIDYAMLASPVISSSALTSEHLGQFQSNAPSPPSPWDPVSLPSTVSSSDEINLVLSTEVANSAGYVYFKAGALTTTVKELPSWSPVRLNTTDFKLLIPKLYDAFPDMDMEFVLAANSTPNAQINVTGATCDVQGTVDVYVRPTPTTRTYAFTLGLTIFGEGKVSVSKSNITAVVAFVGTDLSLMKTSPQVGVFNAGILSDLVNLAITHGLVPWLNKVLAVGFPIPVVDGVTLSNVNVIYGDGYVGLASDFQYAPPASFLKALGLKDSVIRVN